MIGAVIAVVVVGLLVLQTVTLGPGTRSRAVAAIGSSAERAATWLRDHSLAAPATVGLVLRLVWVVVVTETPPPDGNDAAEYLAMADRFTDWNLPVFLSGEPSAFFAPGYPMLLTPLLPVAEAVGWPDPATLAALVNATAGAATVVGAAWLAGRWIGPSARLPTAWLMAVAPAHIYFTATAHAETVFTALFVLLTIAVTAVIDEAGDDRPDSRALLLLGAFIGFTALVRSPGLALLFAPAFALRASRGAWRDAARATGVAVAGAMVVLAPWAIVNGVYVGVWSPLSTQNATVLCVGHHDQATGGFPFPDMPRQMQLDCYRNSPYVDPDLDFVEPGDEFGEPDEAAWYTAASRRGIGWALTHPLEEIDLVREKFVRSWGTEWDALPAAKNYTDDDWAGSATGLLHALANGWLWAVEALGLLGLILVPACRRALPIWGLGGLLAAAPLAGLAQPHFRHPAIPFLAMLAGGAVGAWRTRDRARDQPSPVGAR